MTERRVTVRIDRLVLKGIRPEDRAPIVNSLKEELTRVFSAAEMGDAIADSGSVSVMRLGRVPKERGLSPARALGRHVAQSIGRRVKS